MENHNMNTYITDKLSMFHSYLELPEGMNDDDIDNINGEKFFLKKHVWNYGCTINNIPYKLKGMIFDIRYRI